MSDFNAAAKDWDSKPNHWERSQDVAKFIVETIPLNHSMSAMEFGAGTGILSFLLKDQFAHITLMDSSEGMVRVMHKKVEKNQLKHLKPLLFDLEQMEYRVKTFDVVYTQMVLHHVGDVDIILERFYRLLNPGGYLAIADLYTEDGSFHQGEFNGHLGFDPDSLKAKLDSIGFINAKAIQCHQAEREDQEGRIHKYPIFLLTAQK